MYIWQFCIYHHGSWGVIYGRDWQSFLDLLQALGDRMKQDERLMIYVHNLSFEFQFLTGIYPFEEDDVFCLDKRRIGKCTMFHKFEFRCSYILTNLSLATFCKQMKVKHPKKDGERFDYGKIRTPSMALPTYQMLYCRNDVLGLCECIYEKMKREDDDLYHIPLTATGYIRREARVAMDELNFRYRMSIQPITILEDDKVDMSLFYALRRAFRGGNTHGSRFYEEEICENVFSYDRSSSYPEVICNHEYPHNKMWHIGPISISTLYRHLQVHHMAMLMVLRFEHLRLNNEFISNPYLPTAKMILPEEIGEDNGRLLSTLPGSISEVVVTDVDFRIIIQQYIWDRIEIVDSWGCSYGKLPQPIIDLTIKHYKAKTEYKGVEGMDAIYLASKERLNSIYGMMCQNPCRPSIKYNRKAENDDDLFREDSSIIDEELLRRYSKKGFLPYQWAVWTTAWARWELQRGIDIVEKTDPLGWGVNLYDDTDSVKGFETDIKPDFDAYNKEKIALAEKTGAWADDPQGVRHYMGVYEYEGTSDRFVTLGAKKYCTEKKGKLAITVSGVPKKQGAYELQKKGGIEAFRKGFLFEHAGLAVKYNDHTDRWIQVNGEDIHLTNNIYLYEDTYVLGDTAEYEVAVRISKQMKEEFTEKVLTKKNNQTILEEQSAIKKRKKRKRNGGTL